MYLSEDKKVRKNNSKVQAIIFIVGVVLVLVMLLLFFRWRNSHYDALIKKGGRTIGVLKYVNNGYYVRIHYEVNGNKYSSSKRRYPYDGIQDGERFEIAYNKENKDDFIVLYHKPIFDELKFENTQSINVESVSGGVEFTYIVGKYKYTRFQDTDGKVLKEGKAKNHKYLVKYNKERPAIGYIFLDSIKKI